MKNYLLACLALQISLCAQAQSERSPLDPIYAALQRAAPTPAMQPIPAALINTCNPRSAEIKDELAFETGTVHYMLNRLYVWHTYKQLDGSLCAWLDAPAEQALTRNDVQALETVSWLLTPQVPSIGVDDGTPVPRAISPDFVRSFSPQACESDAPPTANVTMITNNVGFTTADIAAQSGLNDGCVYAPVFGATATDSSLRRIDVVRKSTVAVTGNGRFAFVEIQEAANVPTPPFHFDGSVTPLRPANGTFGAAIFNPFASAFPATGEYFSRNGLDGNIHLSYLQDTNPLRNCPGLVAPNYFGGAFVDGDNVLGIITGTAAECQNAGGVVLASAKYRFDGWRLGSAEFTKFLAFNAAAQPTLAIRLFQPTEFSTIDVALASSQLGCNGPTVTSEIAWRSSLASPITGSNDVGTGCYIPANKLARGTQMLTVYRTTDPRRKSSVKVNAIKSEAHLGLSHTGDYVLPLGSFFLNLQINWNSQDVGNHVFLTEQIDNGAETLLSDTLNGATSRQINTEHVAKYRLRRAMPNAALSGAVLDEKQVTVLSTAVVPLETPMRVTYPFRGFTLRYPSLPAPIYDCPTGICTFVLRWLSDGSFGVQHEIKQRRLDYCDTFEPYTCHFQPWVGLPLTTGSSRVITFAARFDQADEFEFMIRACAPFRGCSDWSVPPTTLMETLYSGSIGVSPTTATWVAPVGAGGCRTIPPAARPTLTLIHNYPFRLTLMNANFRASAEDPHSTHVPQGISTARIISFGFIAGTRGSFSMGGWDHPVLARLNLDVESILSADGQYWTCRYTLQ